MASSHIEIEGHRDCPSLLRTAILAASVALALSSCQSHAATASVYWEGSRTASGERFRPNTDLTAAHRSLPFGSRVRVTNPRNGRSVVVRINDRGPFVHGRDIDLSRHAAHVIGVSGVAHVRLERVS